MNGSGDPKHRRDQEFLCTLAATLPVTVMLLGHRSLARNRIDAFPYNGPGTSNGARPAGRDRVLHAFACRMSASQRKKGRRTLTFLVWRLLDDQTVEGLSEEAGGRLSGRISKLVSTLEARPRD